MTPTAEQVGPVEAWLRRNFPDAYVESGGVFDREVYLFRARDKKAPAPAHEIEISYVAFEDHKPEAIIGVLEQQGAAARMRDKPVPRLFLDRELHLGLSAYDPRGR